MPQPNVKESHPHPAVPRRLTALQHPPATHPLAAGFQQDQSGVHRFARVTSVWREMAAQLKNETFANKRELIKRMNKALEDVGRGFISKLYKDMPLRVQAVITARVAAIRY